MSVQSLSWAFKQNISKSASKFVLVALANFANEDGACYPSIETLYKMTSMDRKTVISALAALCAEGWIEDTGRRCGATHQIKIYRLCFERTNQANSEQGQSEDTSVKASRKRNSTENGTVPFFRGKSTVFPMKESQKRDTEPLEEPLEKPLEREKHSAVRLRPLPATKSHSVSLNNSQGKPKPEPLPENWQPDADTLEMAKKDRHAAGLAPMPESHLPKCVVSFRQKHRGQLLIQKDWNSRFCSWYTKERVESSPSSSTFDALHPSRQVVRRPENDNRNPNAVKKQQGVVGGGLPA